MNTHLFKIPDASVLPLKLVAWRGQSMLVAQADGEIRGGGICGYYFRGSRYLSNLTFAINDHKLRFCSCAKTGFNSMEFFYIYPPVEKADTGGSGSGMIEKTEGISHRGLDIRLLYYVKPSGLSVEFKITNRWDTQVNFSFHTMINADFLPMDQAYSNGSKDAQTASYSRSERGVRFTHNDPDFPLRMDFLLPECSSWIIDKHKLSRSVFLLQGETVTIRMNVQSFDPAFFLSPVQWKQREARMVSWGESLTRLSSDPYSRYPVIVNGLIDYLCSAALLEGESDQWLTPAAGYPYYPFLFGRDALTSSWMMAMFDEGQSISNTLSRLGQFQGKKVDHFRDEHPGRIIQQARNDLPSRKGDNPFDRYYGDYASPFMFIIALAHLYAWNGNLFYVKKHWDRCRKILDWAEMYADMDGDGFAEYLTSSPLGPRHQGWKDSQNAVVDESGHLVDPPVATCEVQGYYYVALQAASLFAMLNKSFRDSLDYARRARRLKRQFNKAFWVPDGGYIAFGLDSKKRQIRSMTSNMGHCLASGIIDSCYIKKVVSALFSSDMYSGWGIRTLSASNPSYNPLSYHLGSVWPVENATIALGLRRYGFDEEALELVGANYELAKMWREGHIPECIGGYDRQSVSHPGAFPRANQLQTWNAAAFGLFTHVLLGLQPLAPLKTLFIDPILPPWLPTLTVENLHIAGATISLKCTRKKTGRTFTKILKKTGEIRVLFQSPVNSLNTTLAKRTLSLIHGRFSGHS
ncbi:glycogen debranching N-terminal domain-containing protein [Chitinispirillales bacterium ANBcel5]|uniref:MGH1-like glycoside hydrolase domain-containing protein n=1 Tax=Cellulosispirillum alkaliphilum TaxID=3039283 RepID=UPI002A55DA0C|nr:glycogen debranching N-terminal domain-containing protein [Chitinispirillales bacterium ANBcel5]